MTDLRGVVIDALDRVTGARALPEVALKLARGEDVALAALELDSLSRFETLMLIEEALGVELDDDDLEEAATVDVLVARIARQVDGANA